MKKNPGPNKSIKPSPAGRKRGPATFRPWADVLEDRLTPATFLVTTFADVVNPRDGVLSLREAISLANATAGPDTILLQAGTYKIGLAGTDNTNARGDFDVTQPLTIVGKGAARTAVEGTGNAFTGDRLFDLLGRIDVTLAGMTLRKGGNGLTLKQGGGVSTGTANLTLNNCVVGGNQALSGGGISVTSGTVTLNNTLLTSNRAKFDGGGIVAGFGLVTLNDRSKVTGNTAVQGNGGGIFSLNTVALTQSSVSGNRAGGHGGGIAADQAAMSLVDSSVTGNFAGNGGGGLAGATATLLNSTVSGNTSGSFGGGIAAGEATVTGGAVNGNKAATDGGGIEGFVVNLTNATVSGNHAGLGGAGNGGGVFAEIRVTASDSTVSDNTGVIGGGIQAGTAIVQSSTVSGNAATVDVGGGIQAVAVQLLNATISGNSARTGAGVSALVGSIVNSTIANNTAKFKGGGVQWDATAGASQLHVENTIIANNLLSDTTSLVGRDVSGSFVSDGHNLIGVVDGGLGFGDPPPVADGSLAFLALVPPGLKPSKFDQLGTADRPLDPMLGALADNGGPTKTHALLAGSSAIDHGDNADAVATDQRGVTRPRDGDGDGVAVVDIGAFEL